jgi:hypothetical protein
MKTQPHTQPKPTNPPAGRPAVKKGASKAKAHPATKAKGDDLDRQRAENEGMGQQAGAGQQGETAGALEGEGSYTASREYREGLERSIREGNSDRLAEEAAKALDGPEGPSLRAAEEAGKRALHH